MLECEILASMAAYPRDISEFLKATTTAPFSKKGGQILEIILNLNKDNHLISSNAILSALPQNAHDDEFVLEFLSADKYPNYLDLAQIFLKEHKIKMQQEIASELNKASLSGVEVDIETLAKKYEVARVEYKTFGELYTQWQNKADIAQYPTGIKFLDYCFNGGLELGQLMIMGGDPEAGKTTLGLQILENLARKNKVCFFCFEFTKDAYFKAKTQRGMHEALKSNMILIDDGYNIAEVANNIKALSKQGVKFFLIDSQMRVTNAQGRNIEEEESAKFSTLARLSHQLNIFIILIIQTAKGDRFNPSNSKKGAHEASISVRIELNAVEKDDLLQKGQEWDENTRTIIVYKNKQTGKHNKEKLAFSKERGIFSEIKENKEPAQVIDKDEIQAMLGAIK